MSAMKTTAKEMTPATIQAVARYFHVLADPTRLTILNELRQSERNVGELAQLCGYTAANISRHLSLLAQQGVVSRTSQGNSVYYRIADAAVYELCDVVCGNIATHLQKQQEEQQNLLAEVSGHR
jgi:DNA-binding transcriptional ArsR family regulator